MRDLLAWSEQIVESFNAQRYVAIDGTGQDRSPGEIRLGCVEETRGLVTVHAWRTSEKGAMTVARLRWHKDADELHAVLWQEEEPEWQAWNRPRGPVPASPERDRERMSRLEEDRKAGGPWVSIRVDDYCRHLWPDPNLEFSPDQESEPAIKERMLWAILRGMHGFWRVYWERYDEARVALDPRNTAGLVDGRHRDIFDEVKLALGLFPEPGETA